MALLKDVWKCEATDERDRRMMLCGYRDKEYWFPL